jgi:hypothetical protein
LPSKKSERAIKNTAKFNELDTKQNNALDSVILVGQQQQQQQQQLSITTNLVPHKLLSQ